MNACEESEYFFQPEKQETSNSGDNKQKRLASILATAQKDSSTRTFLKDEALKQVDGDYNFLFSEALHKPISNKNLKSSGKNTFGDALIQHASKLKNANASKEYEELFSSILKEKPLLQIAIPEVFEGSTEEWDANNKNLLVAYLPDDFDEKTTKKIIAYDEKGKSYEISAHEVPEKPVIIISENERFIAKPKDNSSNNLKAAKSLDEPYYSNAYYDYYLKTDIYPTNSVNITPSENSTTKYDKDSNNGRDVLSKAKFVNKDALRSVESWAKGRPEMKVFVLWGNSLNNDASLSVTKKYLGKVGWIRRNWFTRKILTKRLNIPITTWNKGSLGDAMKYIWYEEDGGANVKNEVSLSYNTDIDENSRITAKTTISINKRDDECGDAIVNYSEDTAGGGTEYNTGRIKFWVTQE